MSYISDFKSSVLGLFNQGYGPVPANSSTAVTGTGALTPEAFAEIGQKFTTADGRTLALVANGATALAAGVLVQAPAEVTAFEKLAVPTPTTAVPASAGTYQVLVTNGSTVLKQNIYAGGYFIVAAGTGIGQTLRINSHSAAANAGVITVNLEDAIITTLDNTSKVSLLMNPYNGVIINPTSATGAPVGVSLYPIAASTAATYDSTSGALTAVGTNQYGFIVTHGFVSCLIDTVTNVGYPLGRSASTAGSLSVATLTTAAQVGISGQTTTNAQNGLVSLYL